MPNAPLPPEQLRLVDRLLDLTIDEDIGSGDATTLSLFPNPGKCLAHFTARQDGIMAGGYIVQRLYARLGARFADNAQAVTVNILKPDGANFQKDDPLIDAEGDAAVILMGERSALNLLQRMCAVAGRTRQYVDKIAGTNAGIYDTRKTNPGHRVLDKLAVRAGGGKNHRMGLYDMILIKDNHLLHYGGIAGAVKAARGRSSLPIMVEVDRLEQLAEALPTEPDYVLLDNMTPEQLAEAVKMTDLVAQEIGLKRPLLEASGGINLDTVAAAAASGVDRISVGALTHGAGSVDIGLDFA